MSWGRENNLTAEHVLKKKTISCKPFSFVTISLNADNNQGHWANIFAKEIAYMFAFPMFFSKLPAKLISYRAKLLNDDWLRQIVYLSITRTLLVIKKAWLLDPDWLSARLHWVGFPLETNVERKSLLRNSRILDLIYTKGKKNGMQKWTLPDLPLWNRNRTSVLISLPQPAKQQQRLCLDSWWCTRV